MGKTLIINLFGGPGTGKSTIGAALFSRLKMLDVECELAAEYAKDVVWEEGFKKLESQIYIFGKQYYRINRLIGKVRVVVTDSPIINSIVYDKTMNPKLKDLILYEFGKWDTLNFFMNRKLKYQENGRMQNLQEAEKVDLYYKDILDGNKIPYYEIGPDGIDDMISKTLERI